MKRAFTLIEAVVVVAIILILAAILFPVFVNRPYRGSRRSSCQSNLKQIGLGFIQYAQDYDERLPSVRASGSTGWADLLQPYVKSTQLFQCPSAPLGATDVFTTDYFYNRRLSRVLQKYVAKPATTIMSGDGPDNAPTWSSLTALPPDATTNSDSFAQRHFGVGNYLFADGHVKSLKPDAISVAPLSKSQKPTFAFR